MLSVPFMLISLMILMGTDAAADSDPFLVLQISEVETLKMYSPSIPAMIAKKKSGDGCVSLRTPIRCDTESVRVLLHCLDDVACNSPSDDRHMQQRAIADEIDTCLDLRTSGANRVSVDSMLRAALALNLFLTPAQAHDRPDPVAACIVRYVGDILARGLRLDTDRDVFDDVLDDVPELLAFTAVHELPPERPPARRGMLARLRRNRAATAANTGGHCRAGSVPAESCGVLDENLHGPQRFKCDRRRGEYDLRFVLVDSLRHGLLMAPSDGVAAALRGLLDGRILRLCEALDPDVGDGFLDELSAVFSREPILEQFAGGSAAITYDELCNPRTDMFARVVRALQFAHANRDLSKFVPWFGPLLRVSPEDHPEQVRRKLDLVVRVMLPYCREVVANPQLRQSEMSRTLFSDFMLDYLRLIGDTICSIFEWQPCRDASVDSHLVTGLLHAIEEQIWKPVTALSDTQSSSWSRIWAQLMEVRPGSLQFWFAVEDPELHAIPSAIRAWIRVATTIDAESAFAAEIAEHFNRFGLPLMQAPQKPRPVNHAESASDDAIMPEWEIQSESGSSVE